VELPPSATASRSALEPGYVMAIGDLGGKVLLHSDATTLPKKRHLMLGFEDGRFLTVAIQGWAACS